MGAAPAAGRIGLLADSHGQAETTQRAVRILVEAGVDLLLHLGDLGAPAVIDALVAATARGGGPRPPVRVVFGNIDLQREALRRRARERGVQVDDPAGRLTAAGKTLVFLHGHQRPEVEQALAEGVDYLCHGHTHRKRDERAGRTRLINPGALFRARAYSVAVLSMAEDRLTFLEVPRAEPGPARLRS